MKVWCVNQFALPPDQAGGTRHVSLAASLGTLGIEVTLVAAPINYVSGKPFREAEGRPWWNERVEGVPFVWLAQQERGSGLIERLRSMAHFARAVARGRWASDLGRPDVIIGSSPSLFGAWGAARLARRLDVPFVLEIRDVWPQSIVDVAGVPAWHPGVLVLRQLEKWLYRRADHIVTLLPGAAAHIEQSGGDAERITWIPNGVVLASSPPAPRISEDGPFRVVYAGAHGPANALDAIVDAAAKVRTSHGSAVEFAFYGAGSAKEELKRRADGNRGVVFHDPVPKQAVPSILASADVLITNTRNLGLYRHGISPNKMFDYLASGRPVVSGSSAALDPIGESGGGIVVTPDDPDALADAVRRLVDAPAHEREAMGRRGRAFVEKNHDIEHLARRLETVLRSVAAPS